MYIYMLQGSECWIVWNNPICSDPQKKKRASDCFSLWSSQRKRLSNCKNLTCCNNSQSIRVYAQWSIGFSQTWARPRTGPKNDSVFQTSYSKFHGLLLVLGPWLKPQQPSGHVGFSLPWPMHLWMVSSLSEIMHLWFPNLQLGVDCGQLHDCCRY